MNLDMSSPSTGMSASRVPSLKVVSGLGGESISTMRSTLAGLASASAVATAVHGMSDDGEAVHAKLVKYADREQGLPLDRIARRRCLGSDDAVVGGKRRGDVIPPV